MWLLSELFTFFSRLWRRWVMVFPLSSLRSRSPMSILALRLFFVVVLLFMQSLSISLPTVSAEGFCDVFAQATATFYPLFGYDETPTPIGGCTGSQPVGALTVTPNTDWYFYCSSCITPAVADTVTPVPTSTHDGVGTAYPTLLPSSTPTPDGSIPTAVNAAAFTAGSIYADWNGGGAGSYSTWACVLVASNHVHCEGDLVNVEANEAGWQQNYLSVTWGKTAGNHPFWAVYNIVSTAGYFDQSAQVETYGVVQYVDKVTLRHADSQPVWNSVSASSVTKWDLAGINTVSTSGTIDLWLDLPPVEVTPTPTPVYSYCSEVDPVDETFTQTSLGGYSGILLGQTECVGIDGFEIDLTLLGLPLMIVPEIQFCMTPISFGIISLLSWEFNLDLIAYAIGAGWLARRWFNS